MTAVLMVLSALSLYLYFQYNLSTSDFVFFSPSMGGNFHDKFICSGEKFPIVVLHNVVSQVNQVCNFFFISRRLHSRRVIALCGFRFFCVVHEFLIPGNRKFQELLKVDNLTFYMCCFNKISDFEALYFFLL
jgi:hypothetical protein